MPLNRMLKWAHFNNTWLFFDTFVNIFELVKVPSINDRNAAHDVLKKKMNAIAVIEIQFIWFHPCLLWKITDIWNHY